MNKEARQATYDKVREHLLTQRKKSIQTKTTDDEVPKGMCLYFGPNGLRCAIGALIPDELKDEVVEGLSPDEQSAVVRKALGLGRSYNDRQFFLDLQSTHDGYNVRQWKNHLETVAAEYGLKP